MQETSETINQTISPCTILQQQETPAPLILNETLISDKLVKVPRAAAVTASLLHKYYQNEDVSDGDPQNLFSVKDIDSVKNFSKSKPKTVHKNHQSVRKASTKKKLEEQNHSQKTRDRTEDIDSTNSVQQLSVKKKQKITDAKRSSADENVYLVERVVDKKQVGRRTLYFVKWEGYLSEENTWEPTSNLINVKHLIKEFNSKVEMSINQDASTCSNVVAIADTQTGNQEYGQNNQIEQEERDNQMEKQEIVEKIAFKASEAGFQDQSVSQQTIPKKRTYQCRKKISEVSGIKNTLPKKRRRTSSVQSSIIPNEPVKQTQKSAIAPVYEVIALPELGDFKYGDIASKVICAKMTTSSIIMVTVSWERRNDGVVPKPNIFTNQVIREHCPRLLVDFYESRINLKSKPSEAAEIPPKQQTD